MQANRRQSSLVRSILASLAFGCATSWALHAAHAQAPASPGGASANNVQQESVKIEPYKGQPIYLEEPEQVAKPKIVTHQTRKENYEDNKTLRVERVLAIYSDESFAADGKYTEYYPNTKPFVQGQFKAGRQDGDWTYYYDNGQINRKTTYANGQPNGSWEVFRADGTLSAKRSFKDGVRDGEWFSYEPTGKQPLTEEHYAKGVQEGVWKSWYANGKPRQEIPFKDGKREGKVTEWNDKGEKLIEAEYSQNKLNGTLTRYLPDGKTIVQQYKENRLLSDSK